MLATVVSIGLVAQLVPLVSVRASALWAPADDIEAKRAEARAIQDQLDALGEQASMVDENLNVAVIDLAGAERRVEEAQSQLRDVRLARDGAHAGFEAYAIELYSGGGTTTANAVLGAGTVNEAARRVVYGTVVAELNLDAFDRLSVLETDLVTQEASLAEIEAQAAAQRDVIDRQRAELQRLLDAETQVLARVEGELARLVAEEEARRRAEEERIAREQAARLAREEAARRAAAEQERRARQQAPAPAPAPAQTSTAPSAAAPTDAVPVPETLAPPPPSSPNATRVIEAARALMGTPYRFGAPGPEFFDCSGFTAWVWREAGASLPHSSRAQYASLPKVSRSDIQPGDLVFFGSPIHHVGVYIGGDQMIDAPYTGSFVGIRSINRRDYTGAVRPG